jgi:hypothetical protein
LRPAAHVAHAAQLKCAEALFFSLLLLLFVYSLSRRAAINKKGYPSTFFCFMAETKETAVASKKLINEPADLVEEMVQGIVLCHPTLVRALR